MWPGRPPRTKKRRADHKAYPQGFRFVFTSSDYACHPEVDRTKIGPKEGGEYKSQPTRKRLLTRNGPRYRRHAPRLVIAATSLKQNTLVVRAPARHVILHFATLYCSVL